MSDDKSDLYVSDLLYHWPARCVKCDAKSRVGRTESEGNSLIFVYFCAIILQLVERFDEPLTLVGNRDNLQVQASL